MFSVSFPPYVSALSHFLVVWFCVMYVIRGPMSDSLTIGSQNAIGRPLGSFIISTGVPATLSM